LNERRQMYENVVRSSVVMTSVIVVHTYAGLLVVISVGVALGVAVGVFLLFALIACHRRYVLLPFQCF